MAAQYNAKEFNHNVANIVAWFKKGGGFLHPGVHIVHNQQMGYHMQAGFDKLQGPLNAVACPLSLSLSHLNLDPSQNWVPHAPSLLGPCREKLSVEVLTRLLLIEQLVLGEDSPWDPYIALLPDQDELTTAMWFNSPFFENTALEQAKREREDIYKAEWKNALSVLQEVGLKRSDLYAECDYDTYKWAATIMTSRSFTSSIFFPDTPSFPILFPVLDIANHSVTTKVRWQITSTGTLTTMTSFDPQENSQAPPQFAEFPQCPIFTIQLLDDVEAGAQIFNNYGPKSNAELLLGYGFAIENNPVEQVMLKLRMSSLPEGDHLPFGMNAADKRDKNRGLRKHDNLLGRYRNDIPFFRGIPSFAVFASYVLAMSSRHKDPAMFNPNQSGRQVMGTLLFLYEAIHAQCSRSPFVYTKPNVSDDQQRYALIYRIGQRDIVHYIRRELKASLEKLRPSVDAGTEQVFSGPCIITLDEALKELERENSAYRKIFETGMDTLLKVNINDRGQLAKSNAEERIWVFLLIVFLKVHRAVQHGQQKNESLISRWMRDLEDHYDYVKQPHVPSPSDRTLHTIHGRGISDFVRYRGELMGSMKDKGLELECEDLWEADTSMIEWAIRVVHYESFALADQQDGSLKRQCMYMRPFQSDRSDEKWRFEEVFVPEQEPEGVQDPRPLGRKFES